MMNLIDKNYPHPVLRQGADEVNGVFEIKSATVAVEAGNCVLKIDVSLENPEIEKLISEKKAQINIFLHCPSNFYRETKNFDEALSVRVEIPLYKVSDVLEFIVLVTATTAFEYQNADVDDFYKDAKFAVSAGDILAVTPTEQINLDKRLDSLKNTESIVALTICDELERSNPLKYELDGDKISVFISRELYNDYWIARRANITVSLETLIFLPILVDILHYTEEDLPDYKWSRALIRQMDLLGMKFGEIEDCFTAAQKLLDSPITRCIDEMKDVFAME